MISSEWLGRFLAQKDESTRIEFKLRYDLTGQNNHKNKNELAKDLIALANTAGRAADDPAHLIIGAGDVLQADGTRATCDVRQFGFDQEQLLSIVNDRCVPRFRDLQYAEIEYAGNYYGVIEIPPSPFVHELSKDLDTPGGTWRRGNTLLRHGSEVVTAFFSEIEAIKREKTGWSGIIAPGGDVAEQVEEYLADPSKKNMVRKLVLNEAKKLHEALNAPEFLAKDRHLRGNTINGRLPEYETLTADLLKIFAVGGRLAESRLDSIWVEALTLVADTSEDAAQVCDECLRLRRYPALLLFYGAGTAAVAGGHYGLVAELFHKTKVKRWGVRENPSFALPPDTVVDYYDNRYLIEVVQHRMPFVYRLRQHLRRMLGNVISLEADFLDAFTRFEYLFALFSVAQGNGVVRGSYMWLTEIERKYRQSYRQGLIPVVSESNEEMERDGDRWLPYQSGIFVGDWREFYNFKQKADEQILKAAETFRLRGDY